MTALDAMEGMCEKHYWTAALLDILSEYCEGIDIDQTVVCALDAIRSIVAAQSDALDALERYLAETEGRPAAISPVK